MHVKYTNMEDFRRVGHVRKTILKSWLATDGIGKSSTPRDV